MQNIINIVLVLALIYLYYRLPSVEKMSNIDKATEDKIREIYKIDTDAIRNLSNLAKDLTVGGKLTVPGGLDLKGNITSNGHLRINKEGHNIGSGNYSMEIFTPNHADVKETSIRFHQGNKYWRQIRCDDTGFRLTDGNNGNLTTLHTGNLNSTNINSNNLNVGNNGNFSKNLNVDGNLTVNGKLIRKNKIVKLVDLGPDGIHSGDVVMSNQKFSNYDAVIIITGENWEKPMVSTFVPMDAFIRGHYFTGLHYYSGGGHYARVKYLSDNRFEVSHRMHSNYRVYYIYGVNL